MGEDCEECSCCCGCSPREEVDLDELGSEAKEVAALFEEVDSHLNNAFKSRKRLIETLHKHVNESPDLKEKLEKVVRSRDPNLIHFVLGD